MDNEKSLTEIAKFFTNITFVAPKSPEEFNTNLYGFCSSTYNYVQKQFPDLFKSSFDQLNINEVITSVPQSMLGKKTTLLALMTNVK